MKDKISHIQIGMFLFLICSSIYLSVSDIVLLRKSGNEVLIAMLVGTLLGLIPVLMYLKINSCLPNLNIFEKNKKLFGNIIGMILNFLLILMYMVFLSMSIRAVVIFVTSKYLQNTPYFLVGMLVIITSLIICFKGIKTVARVSQLSFWASIILVIIIEFFLIKYVEIGNIMPMFTGNYIKDIFDGAIYHASSCGLLTVLLLSINKSRIAKERKYDKTIIMFYLFASLALCLVMFFVISCFGYEMSTLFKYPEYILLKKIGVSNSELHLENLLAFRWIFYMISLANICVYSLIKGVKNFINNKKISTVIIIILSILCVIGGKTAGPIPHSINVIKHYFVSFIALPIFIVITIIFIRCLLYKKNQKTKN